MNNFYHFVNVGNVKNVLCGVRCKKFTYDEKICTCDKQKDIYNITGNGRSRLQIMHIIILILTLTLKELS